MHMPQELYLDHNRLQQLPLSLTRLSNLRRLYVEANEGLQLQQELAQLPAAMSTRDYGTAGDGGAGSGGGGGGSGGAASGGGLAPTTPLAADIVAAGLAELSLSSTTHEASSGSVSAQRLFLHDPLRIVEQQDR